MVDRPAAKVAVAVRVFHRDPTPSKPLTQGRLANQVRGFQRRLCIVHIRFASTVRRTLLSNGLVVSSLQVGRGGRPLDVGAVSDGVVG